MQTQTGTQTRTDWTEALEHEGRTLLEELDALPAARRLFDGSIDKDSYVRYLVQTYHYVRWTTPLLADVSQRMKHLGLHPELAELLRQKAREEHGHERWVLADLRNLGLSSERVEGAGRSPAVTAYIAWNRYTTLSAMPTAFFGTAFMLEYLSVHRAPAAVERLLAANAIPNIHKAVTFLRGHGEADGAHVSALVSALRTVTDRKEQCSLLLSARTTRALYTGLFAGGEGKHPSRTS